MMQSPPHSFHTIRYQYNPWSDTDVSIKADSRLKFAAQERNTDLTLGAPEASGNYLMPAKTRLPYLAHIGISQGD